MKFVGSNSNIFAQVLLYQMLLQSAESPFAMENILKI